MNDDFVPENYEVNTSYIPQTSDDEPRFLQPFGSESPGFKSEESVEVEGLSRTEYSSHLLQHTETNFQAYLFSLAKDMFGERGFENGDQPFGLTLYEQTRLIMYYLIYKRNITSNTAVLLSCENHGGNDLEDFILQYVNDGMPVALNVLTKCGRHTVVAYDYDRGSGRIYVHAGWKDDNGHALTHVSLEQLGASISSVESAFTIEGRDPGSNGPGHHYSSTDGRSFGPQSFVYPRNLRMISGNYAGVRPYFQWDSLYKEKWFSGYNPFIEFKVFNHNRICVHSSDVLAANKYLLPQAVWDQLLNGDPFDDYYVRVSLHSDQWSFDYNLCERHFVKPALVNLGDAFALTPADCDGVFDNYVSDDAHRERFATHKAASGLLFKTRMYRAGRFNRNRIALSPRRAGYQEAYIEYQFVVPVDRIDVELCLWGTRSNEGLYEDNAFVTIDAYRYDEYETIVDLMSDSYLIPAGWDNRMTYKISFARPVTRVRFYARTKTANTNTSNSGRVCIGNMSIYENPNYKGHGEIQDMPTSGYEMPYEAEYWNRIRPNLYNCYCYALNKYTSEATDPGELAYSSGYDNGYPSKISSPECYYTEETIKEMVHDDSLYFKLADKEETGFHCDDVDDFDVCSAGSYKIGFTFDLNHYDYHWYRQNPDGFWSHKPSVGLVRDFDFDGNPICNPSYCNRKSHDDVSHEKQGRYGHDYTSKVFYLEVSPILPPLCEEFGDE